MGLFTKKEKISLRKSAQRTEKKSMFQKAKWIAASDNIKKIQPAPLFRKNFTVPEEVVSAKLYVCGLGLGCFYINGVSITEDVMLTPISRYDARVYYNIYEVKNFLKPGKNVIGAILGNGWYFVTYHRWDYYIPDWLHHPKLLLRLGVEYADGKKAEIVSDSSWKTRESALLYNEDKRGEVFDARLDEPDWCLPERDDSNWTNAFICRSPGGILCENQIPPIRITHRFEGKRISDHVYDIGQNISGWVRITVKGNRGDEVILRYAERVHEDGSIAPELLNTTVGSDTHCDRYILRGETEECWAPKFVYHGFRYVEVSTQAQILHLVGEALHTDLMQVGEFTCGDEMLNRIHHASLWATLNNMHGIPTDCPQREQNGWTGDTLISADQMFMNFDMVSFFKKFLLDIRDTQRPSGQICCIVPTSGWGYNWGSGPAWDSILIQLPYLIYRYTGDRSAIVEMWDSMVLYMEFMDSMAEDNTICFGLGDWCAPKGTVVCPTIITDTGYYYANYCIMKECAQLMEKDGSEYERKAEKIKESFRRKFLHPDFYLGDNTTAIACAIYQGLYEEEERQRASDRLAYLYEQNGFHINCGILGMKYLYTALSEYGHAQTAYRLTVNPEKPSYAYWILNGMTTLCETWEMENSCDHHMYSEVDLWFYKYLAGIRIMEGGEFVCIAPCFLKEIGWVRAKYKGVHVYWDENVLRITSDLPVILLLDGKRRILDVGSYEIHRKEYSPNENNFERRISQ